MALILNGSDTSAGDDAGLGYTSAEGIIITGQGSTSDVTIKNDADATVLSIPTGTTKVGIGTTAAAVNLHVASGADGVAARFSRTSGGGVVDVENYNGIGGIGTSDNIPFRFNTNNTERVRILNDGKVGIGTSAPTRTLTVIGSVGNQFVGSQSQSDDTAKYGTYAGSHYHNSEQDVAGVVVLSNGSDNTVYLGGGVSELNAATVLAFHTGANDATTGGTERMRIAADGKVGIGTNAPETNLHVFKASSGASTDSSAVVHIENSGTTLLQLSAGTSNDCHIAFGDSGNQNIGSIAYANNGNHMAFRTDNAERMRIESNGNLLVGTTAAYSDGSIGNGIFQLDGRNGARIGMTCRAKSSDGSSFVTAATGLIGFVNGNGAIGNISVDGSATSFNTSSDYRLKENVSYTFDATTRLKQLKPARFNFKSDADKTVDGFLAHEVSSIVPEAVTGTKDEVNSDGDPIHQCIDQSKLVPLLVKAMQEQQTVIEALEARITALEGS